MLEKPAHFVVEVAWQRRRAWAQDECDERPRGIARPRARAQGLDPACSSGKDRTR